MQSPTEPGLFKFMELWDEGRKWFEEVQLKREYYGGYERVTRPMWVEERKLEFFEEERGGDGVEGVEGKEGMLGRWFGYKQGFLEGGLKAD